MRQIIPARKVKLFLLILINVVLFTACTSPADDSLHITQTVQSALETAVVQQFTEQPTHTATVTQTPTQTVTPTRTPLPSATPTITPTSWYHRVPFESTVDTRYGLVVKAPVVLYTSAEEASVQGERFRTLPGEEVHVTFSNVQVVDGQEFYEVEPGGWLAADLVTEEIPSLYAGVVLDGFPSSGFGWLVNDTFSVAFIPTSEEKPEKVTRYSRYTLLNVLSVVEDDEKMRWFEIAPDEWISDENFSYVSQMQNPTRGATKRWISVNLTEQYLLVYENDQPIYASLVSTGKLPGWTGSGVFSIYHKDEAYTLFTPDPKTVGNYLIQDVPYILYYEGSWALHGAYWHDNFGKPSSHGCVNLSLADAAWLFDWANEGEWVILYYE